MRPENRVSIWFCTDARDKDIGKLCRWKVWNFEAACAAHRKFSGQCSAMRKASAQLASSGVAPESLNSVAEMPSWDFTANCHWLKHHH